MSAACSAVLIVRSYKRAFNPASMFKNFVNCQQGLLRRGAIHLKAVLSVQIMYCCRLRHQDLSPNAHNSHSTVPAENTARHAAVYTHFSTRAESTNEAHFAAKTSSLSHKPQLVRVLTLKHPPTHLPPRLPLQVLFQTLVSHPSRTHCLLFCLIFCPDGCHFLPLIDHPHTQQLSYFDGHSNFTDKVPCKPARKGLTAERRQPTVNMKLSRTIPRIVHCEGSEKAPLISAWLPEAATSCKHWADVKNSTHAHFEY